MPKTKTANRFPVALLLLVLAAAGTMAVALFVKMTPADRVRPVEKEAPPVAKNETPERISVKIPKPTFPDGNLVFESESALVQAGDDARIEAVNEFLKRSGLAEGSVRLMSMNLEDGLAELHFSQGFDQGQGSADEATLIQGICAVLGQFSEIQELRFFVEGTQLTELGHFEIGDKIATIPVERWRDPVQAESESPPPSMPR